jgi:mono/diheme cytochrome c family protein
MRRDKVSVPASALPIVSSLLAVGLLAAGPVTNKPDPVRGKQLAERLCVNCHLVGSARQQRASADVPSFREIANKPGQTAGGLVARIILPKHSMPQIPLEKSELTDLAAYIMSLRDRP